MNKRLALAPLPPDDDERVDYSQRAVPSYLVGVYVAVNAIRDLYLLVEGPDCAHMKTQYVQGSHDWLSTLTSVAGLHRIANTALHPDVMSGSREHSLIETMQRIAGHPAVPGLAVTSMPMAFVTGADYQALVRQVAEQTGKPVVYVPGRSLSGDWLDGYAEVLLALADQLDFQGGSKARHKVAIVGHLFDRNEGDQVGNVAELQRMVSGLGLELVSVWLSGQGMADLHAARDAGTVVSLPYGRRAARRLAKRLGAELVELPLPFGLADSERFVRLLGEATGRTAEAERFVDAELALVVPKLEWVVPYVFLHRAFGYVGDPHLLPGLASFLETLGAALRFAVVLNRPTPTSPSQAAAPAGVEQLVHPKTKAMRQFVNEQTSKHHVETIIACSAAQLGRNVALFDFGFPSMLRHALYERPFLGLRGALALADDLANCMRAAESEQAGAQR